MTDPFADVDPRVKAVLQQVLAQQQQNSQPPPLATAPTPLGAPPQANGQAPDAMVSAPPPAAVAPPSAQQSPVQPSSLAPVSSPPQTPQNHPGPIKSFLSNFLYGGGQALLQHVGLPTDYEKQQNAQKDALAQQSANDQSQYRQAQTNQVLAKAQEYDRQRQPYVIPNDPSTYGSLAGTPTTVGNFENLSKIGFKNFGANQVAQTKADSAENIQGMKSDTAETLGGLKDKDAQLAIQMRRDIGRGQLGMAGARLQLAQAKAAGQMNGDTPTAQRLNKADLANNAQHNLGNAMDIINQSPDLMGKIAGHFTTIEQMMGTDDPRITRLANELHAAAQASGGVHGLRSADAVKDTEKMWLNGFRNSPQATNAGLQAQSDSLNDYVNFANYGKKNSPRIPNSSQPANAPSSESSHPFFSKFGGTAVTPQ